MVPGKQNIVPLPPRKTPPKNPNAIQGACVVKLTAALIKNAKPGPSPYEIRDTELKGLLVRVQPTGKKSFVCQYRVAGKKTRATIGDAGVVKLPAARNKARAIINAAVSEGRNHSQAERKAKVETLGGYIKHYYRPYAEKHIRSHVDILARLARNFNHLYDKKLADLSEKDIERWRQNKAKATRPVTFETLQLELTYLKAALQLAVTEFKLLQISPLQGYSLKRRAAKPERSNEAKLRYLVRGVEDVRLRSALTARDDKNRRGRESANRWRRERGRDPLPPIGTYSDHVTPIVLLSLNTGLDRGDLFDLTVEQIDFTHNHIRKQRNKTSHKGKPRTWTLPLSAEARDILDTWLQQQGTDSGRVFPSPVTGGRLDNITTSWNSIVKDARLENFRFKDLRHTFASWLAMDGVDLNTIRELMCHTDIKTTLIYAHLSPDHKAAAIAAVFDKPR